MAGNGSLTLTAKISKENIRNLIHSFDTSWMRSALECSKPDCSLLKDFDINAKCKICSRREECEKYCHDKKENFKNSRNISALRTHIIEKTGNSDLHHQNSRGMILCYLALHMLAPDENGICRNVSFSSVAEMTGLAVSTVRRSMDELQKLRYIIRSNTRYDIEYGQYDFCIQQYFKTFLVASRGGKGYIHIDQTTWEALCGLSVNELRVTLLALCDADRADNDAGKTTVKYREFAKYLPGYFCRTVFDRLLNRITQCNTGLFRLAGHQEKDMVLIYRDGMDARERFKNSRREMEKDITKYCKQIDSCMDQLRFGSSPSPLSDTIRELCGSGYEYKAIHPSDILIKDMVSCCIDFTADLVKKAYLQLICSDAAAVRSKDAGAKIRQWCSRILFTDQNQVQIE